MTDKFRYTLIWIAGSICALITAIAPITFSFYNGHYYPIGSDAFYHARRILDAAGPVGFYEFDSHMHVPEGSLITWPWGYDYLMSLIVRAGHAIFAVEPMTVLAQVPMLAFPITIALVVLLSRRVGLGMMATLIAGVFTAFFPLNQTLYAVGAIDHHFAEHLFVLGSLLAGLAWLQKPTSARCALVAGIVLGIAPAFHNGLFVLQLPIAGTFVLYWLRRRAMPDNVVRFGIALVVATLLVSIPSTSFRAGRFAFYTLSWFHVYAAVATAGTLVLLSRLRLSARNAALMALFATIVILPLASQMVIANKFLSATVEGMGQISEAQSLAVMYRNGGIMMLMLHYTALLFLLPVTFALVIFRLWKDSDSSMWLFWVSCLFGLTLLCMQLRLNYFGSYALYLPWLVAIQRLVNTKALTVQRAALSAVMILLAAGCAPAVKHKMFERGVLSGDPVYDATKALYPIFAAACDAAPGVMLVNPDDGHYVRFHTRCSVIANPFLLTPQHEEKIRRVQRLFAMSASELLQRAPDVRYIFARKGTLFYLEPTGGIVLAPYENPFDKDPRLVNELLKTPLDELPPRYHLIRQLTADQEGKQPVARFFEILPVSASAPSSQ